MTNISRSGFLYRNYVLAVGRFDEEVYKCNFFWIAIMYWLFETGTFTERRFIRPILYVLGAVNAGVCLYVAVTAPEVTFKFILLSLFLLSGVAITLGYMYESAETWRRDNHVTGRIMTLTFGAVLGLPILILYYLFVPIAFLWNKLMETALMRHISDKFDDAGYSFARNNRRFKYWITDYTFGIERKNIGIALVAIVPGFFIKGSLLVYVIAILAILAVLGAASLLMLALKALVGSMLFCINMVQKILPQKSAEQIEKERAAAREKRYRQIDAEEEKGDSWLKIAWVFIVAWYHNHLCPPVKFVGKAPVALKKQLKRR